MSRAKSNIVAFRPKTGEDRSKVVQSLFEQYGSGLRTFLLARMTEQADVDDLMQDVFVKIASFEDLETRISPRRGSVRGFLLTMASNLLVDRERAIAVRRRYAQQQIDLNNKKSDDLSPEHFAADEQLLQAVHCAVMAMEERMRWVFIQSRVNFRTYSHIAEEMGVSVKLIDKLMSKALAVIRKAVTEAKGGEND